MDNPRESFDHQFEALRDDISVLSDLADAAIAQSIQALEQQDVTLAEEVMAHDEAINTRRYEIEETCTTLIATQQPAVRDLRAIVAAIHIVTDLKRIADYASGIAELTIQLSDEPLLKPLIDIPRMASLSREMIRASLDAYIRRDSDLARETARRDVEIGGLYDQIYRELLVYMLADPKSITRATHLLGVAHKLERIADRATNICERVVFMVTGEVEELNL